jgi:hypothetical protein
MKDYTSHQVALDFAGAHLRDNSIRASAYDLAPMLQAYAKAHFDDLMAEASKAQAVTTATAKTDA